MIKTCDFLLSAGPACRPGYHLRENGYRLFSSPLDWMMTYSLETYIDVLKRHFHGYFDQWEEKEDWNGYSRWITDVPSGMVSMHEFRWDDTVQHQLKTIQQKMQRRTQRLCQLLRQARSVGWVLNRPNIEDQALIKFFESLRFLYPHLTLHILNINHDPDASTIVYRDILLHAKGSVRELRACDIHPEGDDLSTNGWAWIGNAQLWEKALLDNFSLRNLPDSPAYDRTHIPQLKYEMQKKRLLRYISFGERRRTLKQAIAELRNRLHHAQKATQPIKP